MRSHKHSEKVATLTPSRSSAADKNATDLVTFAQGDLGTVQDILFGAPARQIDQRLRDMEAEFESRIQTMEKKFAERLDQLAQADAEKVSQAKLAKILCALADEVPDK